MNFTVYKFQKVKAKYRASPWSDERGGPNIYVLGVFVISLLLTLYTAFAYIGKIQATATSFNHGIEIAAKTAYGKHAIPDTGNNGVEISDATAFQQEFMDVLQGQMKDWPPGSYALTSLQVFRESDQGAPPPLGFSRPVPGTSVYIQMELRIKVAAGSIPMVPRWSIPIYAMVSSNSYDASTGAWNLAR